MFRKETSSVRNTTGLNGFKQQVKDGNSGPDVRRQAQMVMARQQNVVQGSAGEPDWRHFLTPAFQNMRMVQIGNGNHVTNALVYATNQNKHRDYDPGRFGGLYAPAGEYAYSVPQSYEYYDVNPATGREELMTYNPPIPREYSPSKNAVVGRSMARNSFTNNSQESDTW